MTSLWCCGCHGNQLSCNWFRLIEITKNAYYMCQIFSQSDERCQKYRGGVRLPPPLPPLCLHVTFFTLCLLGLRSEENFKTFYNGTKKHFLEPAKERIERDWKYSVCIVHWGRRGGGGAKGKLCYLVCTCVLICVLICVRVCVCVCV